MDVFNLKSGYRNPTGFRRWVKVAGSGGSFGSRYKAEDFAVYNRFMSLFQFLANMTSHTFNVVLKKFHILAALDGHEEDPLSEEHL